MKNLIIKSFLAFGLLIACSDDPEVSKEEKVTEELQAVVWKIQAASVDGVDRSDLFIGMTIKFSDGTFTVTNGGALWPNSGTWTFTNKEATSFTRDDGSVVTIRSLSDTQLELSLSWTKTTFGPGRNKSVSGQWVFIFSA